MIVLRKFHVKKDERALVFDRGDFVDLRLQVVEVAGQEILTKDKVPLRVNLTAGYRITDVLAAFAKQA